MSLEARLWELVKRWRADADTLDARGAVLQSLAVESCASDLEAVLSESPADSAPAPTVERVH